MQDRFVTHDTFTIERQYNAEPARVFAAWADPKRKSRWFPVTGTFEFRPGGRELHRGAPAGDSPGPV